jgi:broad specificity phosphatase PhoE
LSALETTQKPYGQIILARHGEPALSRKVMLDAAGYGEFWARYEIGGLLPGQTPPDRLRRFVADCGTLVTSTRLRAIQSAQTVLGDKPFDRYELLIEAPLPPPRFPVWVRLSPKIWGFVARVWWWYLNFHDGQESRAEAEARADQAAELLIGFAANGQTVVVMAHGFFNHLIGRSLLRQGWKLADSEGYKYWSMRRFKRG